MTDDLVTNVCRALSHPLRRQLLLALARNECDVGDLGQSCGVGQPTVSKHLAALRSAGLVQVRVDGRFRCYSLTEPELLLELFDFFDRWRDRG